jgi:hypothetical protein
VILSLLLRIFLFTWGIVWRYSLTSAWTGAILGAVFGLAVVPITSLLSPESLGLDVSMSMGLAIGLIFGLFMGTLWGAAGGTMNGVALAVVTLLRLAMRRSPLGYAYRLFAAVCGFVFSVLLFLLLVLRSPEDNSGFLFSIFMVLEPGEPLGWELIAAWSLASLGFAFVGYRVGAWVLQVQYRTTDEWLAWLPFRPGRKADYDTFG